MFNLDFDTMDMDGDGKPDHMFTACVLAGVAPIIGCAAISLASITPWAAIGALIVTHGPAMAYLGGVCLAAASIGAVGVFYAMGGLDQKGG